MKPNRKPGVAWLLRGIGIYPNGQVRTRDNDLIEVTYWATDTGTTGVIVLPRRDARLLAKRINQCLDGSR